MNPAAFAGVFAAAAIAPPVIHEPWTPLPCPMHPSSTVETEGCLEQAVMRSDRRIDAKAARIFRLLARRSDRAAFVAGERAWLVYRRRYCATAVSVFRGGTAEPVAFVSCELRRNKAHLADLAALEKDLHTP